MRSGGERRGSVYDRRRRKEWLLSKAAGFGGDGQSVPCFWCGASLTFATVSADRFPRCGHRGGSYARANIVPSCMRDNVRRCGCKVLARLNRHGRRAA